MMGTHELFTSWSETDSDLHVELGTHAKCGVEGVGTVRFQLESGGSLEVADVLYVPLRRNFSVSMEDKGYAISFEDGQVFLFIRRDLAIHSARVHWCQRGQGIQVAGQACRWIQGDLGSWIDVSDRGRGARGSEG
jgi:hypothetical protein